jgi:hypothetical protein
MKRLHRLLPAALLATLLGAHAAEPGAPAPTYRIVGPDGKITYSDRKPTDPQAQTRALGQKVIAPLLAPSSAPFDLHPATTSQIAPRAPSGDAPPVDTSGKPFPPGLPEAILDVLVHQFFVQTLAETCSRVRPSFAEQYRTGVLNWRDRNADILAKSNRIAFSRFSGEQRDTLRAAGRARLEPLLPRPDAPNEDKMAWCDRMSTDLARRQFELVGDVRVSPIVYFAMP